MTNETLERQLIGLIAADRLDIPISSMSGKLKRMKPKLARAISLQEITIQANECMGALLKKM